MSCKLMSRFVRRLITPATTLSRPQGIRKKSSSTGPPFDQHGSFGNAPPKSDVGGKAFLLVIPITALGLGVWQVYRWRRKLELIEDMERRSHAEPRDLVDSLEILPELEYTPVKAEGRFDYEHQVFLGPRSLNRTGENVPKEGAIKAVRRETGYHIVTPFILSDGRTRVLINRGWVPDMKSSWETLTQGPVEIKGIVRTGEGRPTFVSKRSGHSLLFSYRDVEGMSSMLHTSQVLLDLVDVKGYDTARAFPIPGQTRVSLRNDHVNYFLTWFSLAGITGFMWHRLHIRKLPLA